MKRHLVGVVLGGVLSTTVFCSPTRGQQESRLASVRLPEGFRISFFAKDVPGARSLAQSESGVIYVGTRRSDKVYAVVDDDQDGHADRVFVVASGLRSPNGVAWRDGALYVADISQILRFDDIDNRLEDPPPPVVIRDDYPTEGHHGWKFLRFGPDGWLYAQVGAPCNICLPDDEIFATITRLRPDGSDREIYARGVRNSVGFDFHPDDGALWFTDNGRDRLGDNRPPDELNRAPEPGLHFGYPYCHGGDIPDPEFGDQRRCAEFTPPAGKLGPHVAPLGLRFYTGDMFPESYRNQIFVAEHGSWNRSQKIGYRVTLVRLDGNRVIEYVPFAEGWLEGDDEWGRPVDVMVLPDGSLLVSDDKVGAIYRIIYEG